MDRRTFLKGLTATAVIPVLSAGGVGGLKRGSSSSTSGSAATGSGGSSLVFSERGYTVETTTVSTSSGTKTVTYHFYRAIPYVARPVDSTYQSLDVSVPVKIDGKAVDATGTPVLLDINVAGYTSCAVPSSFGGGGGISTANGFTGSGGTSSGSGSSSGPPSGSPPSGIAPPGGAPSRTAPGSGGGQSVGNAQLALAAGWVVISPGCRGRDNVTSSGKYYGKAPAAIVDLKAAVRYLRHNAGRIPGNMKWITSTGGSAGGALSTLLAASGDSPLYESYLNELGAADASDAIYASASYSPITDLDHADMAYEWMYGKLPLNGSLVDQTYSEQLASAFSGYQASLALKGLNGFGPITSANYADYLLQTYLEPAATKYLAALSASSRSSYLAKNSWVTWSGGHATFTWAKFLDHMGSRLKSVPAFDSFTLANAENIEFGDSTTNARHFTLYSLRHATGNARAQLDADLPPKINMMNPMYFIERRNPSRAKHWWVRTGTLDNNTSHTIVGNLAAALDNVGDNVNSSMYWDGGHAVNEDAPEFITWVAKLTGYNH